MIVLDEQDAHWLDLPGWYVGQDGDQFYVKREVNTPKRRVRERLHRKILGVTDRAVLVDHKNMCGLDNRRENLRLASKSENMCNRTKTRQNSSGFKGVCWHKQGECWQAYITKNKVRRYLGLFDTAAEAHEAYKRAATELHGDFRRSA